MLNEDLYSKDLIINLESFDELLEKNFEINNWHSIQLLSEEGEFLDPISVSLEVRKSGDGIIAKGRVKTLLGLHCSRCLKKMEQSIDETFNSVYVSSLFEEKGLKTEHLESLDDTFFYDGSILDLTDRVIEAIILSVQEKPLCSQECKGLCPVCGTDLNENPQHICCEKEIDPRFEVLNKLLEK
ncbi:MAG TPA: DUF177 domain-containing protein [Petrotogaceae bacterium]|jgi:uncharacterized protein|nr:DUF177 domain-containing protein [Petrotogaceae bacterium]HPA93723.1 DUF177 domain-containing protein [Petrotogaceae bacterium]HQF33168.1 DUF177 domain-containing protein [Petrotogaceae bacterium]HQH32107.1 DUF177 domain-containing protein [Petrotogaceae bacterium]HQI78679.1 DUF177 domain-containing protein [Petrotogaceae bacterium]